MNRQAHSTLGVLVMLLLVGGCTACTPRQVIHLGSYEAPIVTVPLDTATHMEAATVCDKEGNAIIVVSTHADESQLYYTIEHEKQHVREIQRLGMTCRQFQDKYTNNAKFRYQMESEAYCVGFITTIYMRNYNLSGSYPRFVDYMASLFPDIPKKEIEEGLPCKPKPI